MGSKTYDNGVSMKRLRRSARLRKEVPEISLTPLIDTVLVLLIVFMITMPVMQNVISVELPEGESNDEEIAAQQGSSVSVYLTKDKKIWIEDREVSRSSFYDELDKSLGGQREQIVFVKGDTELPFGEVIEIVDNIKYLNGVKYVALATQSAG